MNPTTKKIILQACFFAAIIFVVNLVVYEIFKSTTTGLEMWGDEWNAIFSIKECLSFLLNFGLLFWAGFRMTRNFVELKWWKIALCLLGIWLIGYHIGYFYDVIDFYLIKGLSAPKNLGPLDELFGSMNGTLISPPSYEPINGLLAPFNQMCFSCVPSTSFSQICYGLVESTITKSTWIALIVYFIQQNKRSRNSVSTSELESTPEVE